MGWQGAFAAASAGADEAGLMQHYMQQFSAQVTAASGCTCSARPSAAHAASNLAVQALVFAKMRCCCALDDLSLPLLH